MPENILHLPDYEVTGVQETESGFRIGAKTKHPPAHCPYCGSSALMLFGRRPNLIRDLPIQGQPVALAVSTQRLRCRSCGKTFPEALPKVDERRKMTRRLVAWIEQQATQRSFTSVANEIGVVEGTVRAIFKNHVASLDESTHFPTPRYLGIEEIHLAKPRSVLVNIEHNTIVELLRNRSKDAVAGYFAHLKDRDRIELVSMDMWTPYRIACMAALPGARIIVDKVHVLKLVDDAIATVWSRLRARLSAQQKRGLANALQVLLQREHDLTEQEASTLTGWSAKYAELGLAYRLKEHFLAIYDARSSGEAQSRYSAWKRGMVPEIAPAFADLVRSWDSWEPWILAYFDHAVASEYVESLQQFNRTRGRLTRGYGFEALRARILFDGGAAGRTCTRSDAGVDLSSLLKTIEAGGL